MTDFEQFILQNNILKKDIASYLGVSNAFVSQVCAGRRALPEAKIASIKANDKGWDTSMLSGHRGVVNSGIIVRGNNNGNTINQDNRQYYSDSPDVLRAQIDMLDERIKEKDAQIKEKDAQIKEKDAQIKQLLDIIQGRNAIN